MRAVFIRKAINLKEVEEETDRAQQNEYEPFVVVEELKLENKRFQQIANNLMKDVPEISGKGGTINGVVQAIRIVNQETGKSFLVNPEGYSYPRYVAIEK